MLPYLKKLEQEQPINSLALEGTSVRIQTTYYHTVIAKKRNALTFNEFNVVLRNFEETERKLQDQKEISIMRTGTKWQNKKLRNNMYAVNKDIKM